MAPKAPRVAEGPTATPVLWDPLGRRYVTPERDWFPGTDPCGRPGVSRA